VLMRYINLRFTYNGFNYICVLDKVHAFACLWVFFRSFLFFIVYLLLHS